MTDEQQEVWVSNVDREPPPGTTVLRDGEVWGRGYDDPGDGWANWTRREPYDRDSDPESWTRIGEQSVKVVEWGDEEWRP